jgi:hypothetical protein
MVLPDRFLEHDAPAKQWIDAGLTAADIENTVRRALVPTDRTPAESGMLA